MLDEAQLLPPEFLRPILKALDELRKNYKVTVVLCTATQPALGPHKSAGFNFEGLEGIQEIMEDPLDLFANLKRVELKKLENLHEPWTWKQLAEQLSVLPSVLCIVNRRDDCRQLWSLMPSDTFHLSALMCGAHRSHRIAEIKQHLDHMPIIGNGDLQTPEQVRHAYQHYNVDGVMIARAALGKPWLFAQSAAALEGRPIPPDPSIEEQRQIMLHHYELVVERFGIHRGTMLMRKFACCYAQNKPGARHFRAHISRVETQSEFYEVVEKFFPTELEADQSSTAMADERACESCG